MCFVRSEKSHFTPLTYRDRKGIYMKYSWGKIVVRVISRLYFSIVENEDDVCGRIFSSNWQTDYY